MRRRPQPTPAPRRAPPAAPRRRVGVTIGKRHPKASRADRLEKYLQSLAGQMILADWDVVFDDRPIEESEAQVCQMEDQHASIRVNPRFWMHSRDYQRTILVHELCHLAFTGGDAFSNALATVAPGPAGEAVAAIAYANEEHAVQWMARHLAPGLALPPVFARK